MNTERMFDIADKVAKSAPFLFGMGLLCVLLFGAGVDTLLVKVLGAVCPVAGLFAVPIASVIAIRADEKADSD